jgi:thiol-disulfide isomerase/thioredoxin
MLQSIVKRVILCVASAISICGAFAQNATHIVTANFSEKTLAEVVLHKFVDNSFARIAEFKISGEHGNFVFPIPQEAGVLYRLQINLMAPGERHNKVDKICIVPLTLNADRNYSLSIAPSKIDTVKKTGWQLKEENSKSPVAIVSGKILNAVPKIRVPLSICSVAEGSLVSNSTYSISEGNFAVPCDVKQPGFYYISSPRWIVRVYLKPAEHLELNIDNMTGMVSSVNGSVENQQLYQWQQLIAPITNYGYYLLRFGVDSVNLNSYMETYKRLLPAMNEFAKNAQSADKRFAVAFQNVMDLDKQLAPINLFYQSSAKKINGFRMQPKEFGDLPEFYRQFIQPERLKTAGILQLGEARQFLNLYAKLNLAAQPQEKREKFSQSEKLGVMMNAIANDTLKSLFLMDQMGQIEVNNLSEFNETFAPFKKYASSGKAKTMYQDLYGRFSGDTAYLGKSSYNFTLPDVAGHMVSMKDYKGKVVFIDVWATWCGPCKAQIPFLKEIEEEYKDNKDIVFVGISLDNSKSRQKWIDFVAKEKLAGAQMIDEDWSQFAKKYGITAIPRFMLIDKQGKWIEVRCPLPESKEQLKKYLDRALQQ